MTETAEKTATLDERIASALGSSEPFHPVPGRLLSEVDQAIDHCDQTSREGRAARIRSEAIGRRSRRGSKAEDAEFRRLTYRAGGGSGLKELLGAAVISEAQASWETEAGELRKEVDEIAAYFKRVYSETAGHLVGVLEKMAAIDQRLMRSTVAPLVAWLCSVVSRRLRAAFRGSAANHSCCKSRLPKMLMFDTPEAAPLAWPPVAVNHAARILPCGTVPPSCMLHHRRPTRSASRPRKTNGNMWRNKREAASGLRLKLREPLAG